MRTPSQAATYTSQEELLTMKIVVSKKSNHPIPWSGAGRLLFSIRDDRNDHCNDSD